MDVAYPPREGKPIYFAVYSESEPDVIAEDLVEPIGRSALRID